MKRKAIVKVKEISLDKLDEEIEKMENYEPNYNAIDLLGLKDMGLEFAERDFFMLALFRVVSRLKENNPDELLRIQEIEEALHFFNNYVVKVTFTKFSKKQFKWDVNYNEKADEDIAFIKKKIKEIMSYPIIRGIVETFILELKKKNVKEDFYKRSADYVDQVLKYDYPKDKKPNLFEGLENKTLRDIETAGVELEEIVEGIKLSPSETKLVDSLCKLLHDNSQTTDAKKIDYYTGNRPHEITEYGGDSTPAPKLAFTIYELTKEYKGGEYVSGKDIENVKNVLIELDKKRFLLLYKETTTKKDGSRIERKIEGFRKLINIDKFSETLYSNENIELSKREEVVVTLNPIFRRQINSKFIKTPTDINRRTAIAYGSNNISETALRLRDYLMRELSAKRYEPEIYQDKLYYMLAEKWMKEGRKKKVKEYTIKAIDTVIELGLLTSYEIVSGASGEPKIVFTLNKEWR